METRISFALTVPDREAESLRLELEAFLAMYTSRRGGRNGVVNTWSVKSNND